MRRLSVALGTPVVRAAALKLPRDATSANMRSASRSRIRCSACRQSLTSEGRLLPASHTESGSMDRRSLRLGLTRAYLKARVRRLAALAAPLPLTYWSSTGANFAAESGLRPSLVNEPARLARSAGTGEPHRRGAAAHRGRGLQHRVGSGNRGADLGKLLRLEPRLRQPQQSAGAAFGLSRRHANLLRQQANQLGVGSLRDVRDILTVTRTWPAHPARETRSQYFGPCLHLLVERSSSGPDGASPSSRTAISRGHGRCRVKYPPSPSTVADRDAHE